MNKYSDPKALNDPVLLSIWTSFNAYRKHASEDLRRQTQMTYFNYLSLLNMYETERKHYLFVSFGAIQLFQAKASNPNNQRQVVTVVKSMTPAPICTHPSNPLHTSCLTAEMPDLLPKQQENLVKFSLRGNHTSSCTAQPEQKIRGMPKGMIFLQVVNAETKALGRAFWSSSVQTPALSGLKTELRPGCAGFCPDRSMSYYVPRVQNPKNISNIVLWFLNLKPYSLNFSQQWQQFFKNEQYVQLHVFPQITTSRAKVLYLSNSGIY